MPKPGHAILALVDAPIVVANVVAVVPPLPQKRRSSYVARGPSAKRFPPLLRRGEAWVVLETAARP